MKYDFPEIVDLAPVRQLVLDVEGFNIIRRPDHIVVCYSYNSPEVFPPVVTWADAVRRECRGLAFDLDGKLISRPYHKFFNLGERTETLPEAVDLARPHVILEKLDGSMIRPIPIGSGFRLGTKTGVTPLSVQPEAFIAGTEPNETCDQSTGGSMTTFVMAGSKSLSWPFGKSGPFAPFRRT